MGEKPVVLLVEDNPGDVRLMQELLAEAGDPFELETAGQVSEAVDQLTGGTGFACVLLDLTLPDSSGIATFYRVLAAAAHVPVIVLSGLSDETLALKTVQEGAQDYLVKGHVDRHTLIRAVNYAIKRAEADRALSLERNLLRSVIDNLLDAIYVKDSQGRYLLDNGTHRRLLGVGDGDSIVGKNPYDFFSKAAAQKLDEIDQRVLETGQPVINREGIFAGDASGQRWMATTVVPLRGDAGEVIGVVGIGRDISERVQAQEQLDRYHKEIRSRNRELEDDLQMAREIQQAFLPQQFPTFALEPDSE
ncbi:MAG TPA: PAS domain-containing protein, partial [Chthoniobacteraceae bacterium]|nr:PAS domain-containing protein [Chthoniobacteraceae bacterium]